MSRRRKNPRSTTQAELWIALEIAVAQLSCYAKYLNELDGMKRKEFVNVHGFMSHLRLTGKLANPENLSPQTTNQTQ